MELIYIIKDSEYKNKYLNSAELLDLVFYIYKKSFFKQIIYSIFTSAIIYGFIGFGYFLYDYYTQDVVLGLSQGVLFIMFMIFIVAPFVFVIWFSLNQTGNMFLAKQIYFKEEANLLSAIKFTFKNIFRIFTVGLGKFIINFGLIILLYYIISLFIGVFLVAALSTLSANGNFSFFIIFILFIFAVIVVCFYFAIDSFFMISAPCAVFDKKYFMGAIGKSYNLISKSYFKNYGSYLVIVVITKLVQYSLTIGLSFFSSVPSSFINVDIFYSWGFVLSLVFTALINIIINPILPIFSTVTYFNEKIKTDGLDIRLKLNELTANLQE